MRGGNIHASFRRLPYNFCALGLQPFTNPVCTSEGHIFDQENIIRWLLDHKTNPVDGEPLKQSDLIKLSFARNSTDNYVDPISLKEFTDNTHIVAVRHGDHANVFAYDTLERLNFKPRIWKDLLTDEDFTKKDLITLQDPQNIGARDLNSFKYLKDGQDSGVPKGESEVNAAALGNAARILKAKEAVARSRADRASNTATKQADSDKTAQKSNPSQIKTVPYNAARYTSGLAAASFTSTGVTPNTSNSLALLSDEEYLLKRGRVKQKGYARIQTTLGELIVELYPEHAPKAVWNFVKLAQTGYYDGIKFHRNIRNFMIQGGDPTGTGRGGKSIWGKNFEDELEGPLKHDSRGIVSMANKGKDTNSSQFFITYRQAPHLDHKHSIFGRVVDSETTLQALEEAPTSKDNVPEEDITMISVVVYSDPFETYQTERQRADDASREKEQRRENGTDEDERTTWTGKRIRADGVIERDSVEVGRYLKTQHRQAHRDGGSRDLAAGGEEAEANSERPSKKIRGRGRDGFGDFDGW